MNGQNIYRLWCTCLLQRNTTTYLQLIVLWYRLSITRYPGGLPFLQSTHWFSFQRNCSQDQFTLLPCHTMFWSDHHVHFRSASSPCGHHSARQSSHCPCGQSSIPNVQSFTMLETCCMLSKGRGSCWWMPSTPQAKLSQNHMTNEYSRFAPCRSEVQRYIVWTDYIIPKPCKYFFIIMTPDIK